MPYILQGFFARATAKAKDDLIAAFLRLPEDKRAWSAMGDARTALDQISECAILNGATADMIMARAWTMGSDFKEYDRKRSELSKDWNGAKALLDENTSRVIDAMGKVSDDDLSVEIEFPWAKMTLSQVIAYPYWNMCYHEGQINYIASMLGCLK
jgi:uncharacterized damage-inducible protein DinB